MKQSSNLLFIKLNQSQCLLAELHLSFRVLTFAVQMMSRYLDLLFGIFIETTQNSKISVLSNKTTQPHFRTVISISEGSANALYFMQPHRNVLTNAASPPAYVLIHFLKISLVNKVRRFRKFLLPDPKPPAQLACF